MTLYQEIIFMAWYGRTEIFRMILTKIHSDEQRNVSIHKKNSINHKKYAE